MDQGTERIKAGGLKVLEGGVSLTSSFLAEENLLGPRVCEPLARNRINLTLLAHVAGGRGPGGATLLCTRSADGAASYSLLKATKQNRRALSLPGEVVILTLYPHNQHPGITGHLLLSLIGQNLAIYGLATSPAAIAVVLPAAAKDRAVRALFQHFTFPSYQSFQEFQAAQSASGYSREVVAAFHEKVIRIYGIQQKPGLDLCSLSLPGDGLEDLASGLIALGDAGVRVPFLLAVSRPGKESLFTFSTAREQTEQARFILEVLLPGREPRVTASVAEISIHGPHFGDRWGIAAAFVKALERAEVALLAMSCAVSSICAVIREQELARAVSALEGTFAAPDPSRAEPRRT